MTDYIIIEVYETQTVLVTAPGPQGPPGDTSALLGMVNAWTRQQYYPLSVLSINIDKTIDWDWNTQPEAAVTLPSGDDYTLNMPANRQPGIKTLRVYQDATGGAALAFDPGYLIDVSLNSLTFIANSFVDLYFKDDDDFIVVFGGEYTTS